ncbi:HTH-type transcriptional regulator GalR [Bienertia sinuspersici]
MASGLEDKWRNMTLTEADSDALIEDDEPDELTEELVAHSLVGKLMTNIPFNPEALKNTMKSLWKPTKGLVVREIEDNIFGDREKVLDQGPWSFDGKLLLLKEIRKGEQPAEMNFDKARFWVKAYQIPVDKRRKSMAMSIANKMGTFIDYDGSDPFGYKKYMRFRVDLEVS